MSGTLLHAYMHINADCTDRSRVPDVVDPWGQVMETHLVCKLAQLRLRQLKNYPDDSDPITIPWNYIAINLGITMHRLSHLRDRCVTRDGSTVDSIIFAESATRRMTEAFGARAWSYYSMWKQGHTFAHIARQHNALRWNVWMAVQNIKQRMHRATYAGIEAKLREAQGLVPLSKRLHKGLYKEAKL